MLLPQNDNRVGLQNDITVFRPTHEGGENRATRNAQWPTYCGEAGRTEDLSIPLQSAAVQAQRSKVKAMYDLRCESVGCSILFSILRYPPWAQQPLKGNIKNSSSCKLNWQLIYCMYNVVINDSS